MLELVGLSQFGCSILVLIRKGLKQDQRSTAPTRYQLGPFQSNLGPFESHSGTFGNPLKILKILKILKFGKFLKF